MVDNNVFDVTYTDDCGPQHPFAMGKSIIEKNPFTYRTYPRTPLTSPKLSPSNTVTSDKLNKCSNSNNDKMTATIVTQATIIRWSTAFKVFSQLPSHRFTRKLKAKIFSTTTDIYNSITKLLPRLPKSMKISKFGKIVKDSDFGERISRRVEGKVVKGRMHVIGNLVETTSAFRTEVNNSDSSWVNVGYVRKSPGNENVETRQRLLEAMIMKLRNRCFCLHVFASTSSTSSSPILESDFLTDNRDNSKDNNLKANSLAYCDGDTQAMIDFIGRSIKKVRLCVISYAGLSNNPDDVPYF